MGLQDEKLNELSNLLKESIDLYRADRDLALKHYKDIKSQLENVLDQEFEMSQDGILESESNKALKLVFDASKKLDKVIYYISNVVIAQLNNESREKIATSLASGGMIPSKPVDFKQLRNQRAHALEYEDED